jgi:hypothetical protein
MGHKKKTQQPGVWKKRKNNDDSDLKVIDTSYDSFKLADLVAEAWLNQTLRDALTTGPQGPRETKAQAELLARGIHVTKAIVLTEDEYKEGWQLDDDDEVALVLPSKTRVKIPGGATKNDLLETARMLMACTPHGI